MSMYIQFKLMNKSSIVNEKAVSFLDSFPSTRRLQHRSRARPSHSLTHLPASYIIINHPTQPLSIASHDFQTIQAARRESPSSFLPIDPFPSHPECSLPSIPASHTTHQTQEDLWKTRDKLVWPPCPSSPLNADPRSPLSFRSMLTNSSIARVHVWSTRSEYRDLYVDVWSARRPTRQGL